MIAIISIPKLSTVLKSPKTQSKSIVRKTSSKRTQFRKEPLSRETSRRRPKRCTLPHPFRIGRCYLRTWSTWGRGMYCKGAGQASTSASSYRLRQPCDECLWLISRLLFCGAMRVSSGRRAAVMLRLPMKSRPVPRDPA